MTEQKIYFFRWSKADLEISEKTYFHRILLLCTERLSSMNSLRVSESSDAAQCRHGRNHADFDSCINFQRFESLRAKLRRVCVCNVWIRPELKWTSHVRASFQLRNSRRVNETTRATATRNVCQRNDKRAVHSGDTCWSKHSDRNLVVIRLKEREIGSTNWATARNVDRVRGANGGWGGRGEGFRSGKTVQAKRRGGRGGSGSENGKWPCCKSLEGLNKQRRERAGTLESDTPWRNSRRRWWRVARLNSRERASLNSTHNSSGRRGWQPIRAGNFNQRNVFIVRGEKISRWREVFARWILGVLHSVYVHMHFVIRHV